MVRRDITYSTLVAARITTPPLSSSLLGREHRGYHQEIDSTPELPCRRGYGLSVAFQGLITSDRYGNVAQLTTFDRVGALPL